ncbi:MAG TPA: prepilin-type N-terminal cleavage/methylation domain-containing protein [Pyrinomonadaceae bacterium]|nr:prepilin-type N-terminal cleavage/methylation domain-containing protein [Pyrinomonadaceae bacterium]
MKTQTPKNKKGQQGFTLMETSIAMVVMMVGALGIASLFVFSTQNNVGGSERALAMAVAQQQLEQIRSVTYDDTNLNVGTVTSTVRSAEQNYSVQRTVAQETNPNGTPRQLKKITIRVTPQVGGPNWLNTAVVLVSFRSTLATGSYLVTP